MATTLATSLTDLLHDVGEQLLHPNAGDFVGRAYVRDEIAKFLAVRNRMMVLVGSPGVGKTALAAQLVREHLADETPYLAHFCALSGDDNPYRFCDALAQQLHGLLGDAYTLPETVRKQQVHIQASATIGQASGDTNVKVLTLNIGGMHPREAFRQAVREPLRIYHEQHGAERAGKPLLIVIDGLDRAWEWDGGQDGNIVGVLADAQDLPPWVNLLCTARPGPAVQTLRAYAGVRVIDLQDPELLPGNRVSCHEHNLRDIEAYFGERLLAPLAAEPRARLAALLAAAGHDDAAFVRHAVAASQGNFLFVRRYADALRGALEPAAAQPGADPAALLRFDAGTLAATLDSSYAAILQQLRRELAADPGTADEDVLAALAIACAPLNLALLACLTQHPPAAIEQALAQRLKPVVAQAGEGDARAFALYHRGFAEHVRQQLAQQGRAWDVQAAQRLEHAASDDAALREYSARHRWAHLLRGLDLAAAARASAEEPDAAAPAGAAPFDSIAQIQAQVHDPVMQAQLLRGLAARALDPAQSDATGSWAAAISCLKTAEAGLRRSRALLHSPRRGWHADAPSLAAPELIELERTLAAQGDAYSTIARRMNAGGKRPTRPAGIILWLYLAWDILARLPLTLYLLFVLLRHGVRELHIPGALQNLGRGQDWTVARLCVLSVSAYRRARAMARARGDEDSVGEVTQRLARLYVLMGAYDAAVATYEALLARPSTLTRSWRQAVWRLELGEALVAQEKSEQAVEALNSALPVFIGQETPVPQARTLSALAGANYQRAGAADRRRDSRIAATLDDLALQNCREALAAWHNVTTLQGDESVSIDPALAVSTIAHLLWRAERQPRTGAEQRHSIRALLDGIAERHYPQRFAHPLLRLFRISAAVFLPAYLLFGLLIAVQLPSDITIHTQTELTFPPPLVDLTRFPNDLANGPASAAVTNDLVAGRASRSLVLDIGAFDVISLTQLAESQVKLAPTPPPLDPLGTIRRVLLIMGLYLTTYMALGLAVISFSSPAQFQSRRPGRLILRQGELHWRGPAGQGSLMDALIWLRQDLRALVRRIEQRAAQIFGAQARTGAASGPGGHALALSEISDLIAVDRRMFGYLLHEFSFTLVRRRDAGKGALIIPGTAANYAELCDELELRLRRPRKRFSVEIVRSGWGICFLITLAYALALLLLLALQPAPLHLPVLFGYSLVNLYVIATPGLLIPLVWWFVAQPLGANSIAAGNATPLLATAAAGGGLTIGVLMNWVGLAALGLQPDLATPLLAGGLMLTVARYAPPRPLRLAFTPRPLNALRLALALLALAGLLLLGWHMGQTLRWYDALVRGNRHVERALAAPACLSAPAGCAELRQAVAAYSDVICLRPANSDGYAFRGFAFLLRSDYDQARADFERALGARPPSEPCAAGALVAPSAAQAASLHANIGAIDTLRARLAPPAEAALHYHSALRSYARALGLPAADAPSCAALAGALAGQAEDARLDLLAPPRLTLRSGQSATVIQLADTCYNRGMAVASTGGQPPALRAQAWDDLAAAIVEYQAVAAAAGGRERELAQRGAAAAWLALSQIEQPPAGQPDRETALLRAIAAYQALDASPDAQLLALAGQAWSSIQIGAWGNAKAPLAAAARLAPHDPTVPALQGLTYWLDATQYPAARKGAPSPGYTAALRQALDRYSHVIELGGADMPSAYATRSLLNFSLRNSPRPDAPTDAAYQDTDYSIWMRRAIADATAALLAAEQQRMPAERQVGYRYWRARMQLVLGLTLQEKNRGAYTWDELAALYSAAYADYTEAIRHDPLARRRNIFVNYWIPWTRALLNNANHLQLAHAAAQRGEFAAARAELQLANPSPAEFQKWDKLAAPLPDFHYLHGLVSLGLGLPSSFANPLLARASAGGLSGAEASYAAAIAATEDGAIVPQRRAGEPDDARPGIYRAALADLDVLLAAPPAGWPAQARAAATRIRAQLVQRLATIEQPGLSGPAAVPAPGEPIEPFANR